MATRMNHFGEISWIMVNIIVGQTVANGLLASICMGTYLGRRNRT